MMQKDYMFLMFTSQETNVDNKRSIIRPLLLLAGVFLFSSQVLAKKVTVAILDTGFCIESIKTPKNIRILPVLDLTKSVKLDCNKQGDKRRFHGQLVLNTFLQNIKSTTQVEIKPIIIFDNRGKQNLSYWRDAYKIKADIYLVAAGLPFKGTTPKIKTSGITFVSQGRLGQGIEKGMKLWPQELSKKNSNILVIGAHHPPTPYDKGYPDKNNLYKEQVRYSFVNSNKDGSFTGSSYTVALALSKAIDLCAHEIDSLQACLRGREKKINWDEPYRYFYF